MRIFICIQLCFEFIKPESILRPTIKTTVLYEWVDGQLPCIPNLDLNGPVLAIYRYVNFQMVIHSYPGPVPHRYYVMCLLCHAASCEPTMNIDPLLYTQKHIPSTYLDIPNIGRLAMVVGQ